VNDRQPDLAICKLLVYLPREIDLVNEQVYLSGALTTAFIGGIEFV